MSTSMGRCELPSSESAKSKPINWSLASTLALIDWKDKGSQIVGTTCNVKDVAGYPFRHRQRQLDIPWSVPEWLQKWQLIMSVHRWASIGAISSPILSGKIADSHCQITNELLLTSMDCGPLCMWFAAVWSFVSWNSVLVVEFGVGV